MSLHMPRLNSRVRLVMLAYGAWLLFWMSLEDRTTLTVALSGGGLALLMIAGLLLSRLGGTRLSLRQSVLLSLAGGAIWGALSVLMTVFLMFFKTAWHAHPFPDYPLPMMLDMLQRLPVWSLAGFCAGLALILLRAGLPRQKK